MRQLPQTAGGVLSYFTRHRTAANLLLVIMLVLGLFSMTQIRSQFFPDVVIDSVTVSVRWDGAGPSDIDNAIVAVLEPTLLTVEGVENSESVAVEGRTNITLEFAPGWDMARAADDVKVAVDSVTDLPQDADEPVVRRGAWRDRVTDIVIAGPVDPEQLGRYADELVARLFRAGVTRTTIRGVDAPQIYVEVSQETLIRFDLTMRQIADAIGAETQASPVGDVAGGQARVRSGVEKRTPEEIGAIVVRSNSDGSKLRVRDVAQIKVEGTGDGRAYFVGEHPAVSIRVDRADQGDAIDMQSTVQDVADDLALTLPDGVTIELIRTRAQAITDRLNILFDNGIVGLALVVGLLFIFLNTRTAFWVAAGIPAAMFAAVALMYASGLTLNMVSLFGLIITLGIVVDDAIVVGEHADFRARRLAEPAVIAAENAAIRMAPPVFSATITTIIAFFGLTAVGGRFGQLIADIPFTVIVVLIASLIECFVILPNHMSHALSARLPTGFRPLRVLAAGASFAMAGAVFYAIWALMIWGMSQTEPGAGDFGTYFAPQRLALLALAVIGLFSGALVWDWTARQGAWITAASRHGFDSASTLFNAGFDVFRQAVFRRFIGIVLTFRYPVMASVIVLLTMQVMSFWSGEVRWRFFNAPERGSISGNIAMLPGATRADTLEMVRELQRAVRDTATKYETEHGTDPVVFTLAEIGGTTGRGIAGSDTKDPDQLGSIAIELIDADLRPYSSFAFLGDLQDAVRRHPMLETVSFRGWRSGPGGDALDVQMYGASLETLKEASEALKLALERFPEVSAVEDNLAFDKEEMVLELTPQGQALGFTIDAIGRELRNRLNGIEAASFPSGVRTSKVHVHAPEQELTQDYLQKARLRTQTGTYVPLSDIVTVSTKLGFSTLRRENSILQVSVNGDISEDDPARAEEVSTQIRAEIMPRIATNYGIEWRMAGLAEQEQQFLTDSSYGFALCMLGIYLCLTWIFASWMRPLVVMIIIPFGLIGTIYGHAQWNVPLSMFSVVGLIGLSGIIINDSIVLVTTIDEYAEGRGLRPAIIDAASDRFRPVLLTTLTTVLGLLPLMFETSRQAQFLKPTVITLSYGLGVGLFLVLLVVPSMVMAQQDVGRLITSWRRGVAGRRIALAPRLVFWAASAAAMALVVSTIGYWAVFQDIAPWFTQAPLDRILSREGLSPLAANWLVLVLGLLTITGFGLVLAGIVKTTKKTFARST